MPKKDDEEAKKLKVKVVEEESINSVPPVTDAAEEAPLKEEKHSDIGFSEPVGAPTAPEDEVERKGTPFLTLLLAFLGGFLIGALLVGGIFYFKSSVNPLQPTPLPTEQPTTTPEASASPSADLSKYKVQVLNGSGTSGEATVAKNLLEKAGFENINTGNAKTYDFKDTVVAMKKDTPDAVFSAIQTSLSAYKVTKGDALSASSTYDVVVTVGSTKTQ